MKVNKMILGMIAVVAIGMFALPSTFSFEGEMHTFKQIDPTDVNAFCLKCHNDNIAAQLALSDDGLYTGMQIHSSVQCQGCHQITRTAGLNGYNVEAPSTEHAARLPSCLDCHNTGTGLQLDTIGNAGDEMRVGSEAHQNFKFVSDNDLECIGCHTGVPVAGDISYDYQSQAQKYAGLTVGSSTEIP